MKKEDYYKHRDFSGIVLGLFFCLFFRISSWLCSVPMWLTLLLHFLVGLDIKWFWATLIIWLFAGIARYFMIVFARWGSNTPDEEKENKNPYSNK